MDNRNPQPRHARPAAQRPAVQAQKRPVRRKKRVNGSMRILSCVLLIVLMGASFGAGWFFGVKSTEYSGDILLVNSQHRLTADYVPEGLVNLYNQRHSFRLANANIYLTMETYEAMEEMFAAAEKEGMNGFIITSGYRDYQRQAEIYAETEAGKAQEPGASEHQTGMAFDVTCMDSQDGFETTPQYKWLMENAHEYGFIQRYPPNKAHETGISYEPWHYRYVGVKAAKAMKRSGQTLEAYMGVI